MTAVGLAHLMFQLLAVRRAEERARTQSHAEHGRRSENGPIDDEPL
jgi:hypothetical protein